MIIRLANASDEQGVRACAQDAYARFVIAIGREPAPMIADFRTQIAKKLIHVASTSQHEIQGFMLFYPRQNHMFLENIAVCSGMSGQGIGK